MDAFTSFQEELIIHGDSMLYWAFSPPEPAFDLITATLEPVLVEPPSACRTAFEPYTRPGNGRIRVAASLGNGGRRKSIHRRMVEMLGRIPKAEGEWKGVEMSRGFKHMMRERQRREKLGQSYAELHSVLSSRSKGDKNSIVQSATIYVRELRETKEKMQKQNEELMMISRNNEKIEKINIEFQQTNPSSAIESIIGALRCLKAMNVKGRSIQCNLSNHKLSSIMSIEAKMAAGEVERAVEVALMDVEKKLLRHFPRTHG